MLGGPRQASADPRRNGTYERCVARGVPSFSAGIVPFSGTIPKALFKPDTRYMVQVDTDADCLKALEELVADGQHLKMGY